MPSRAPTPTFVVRIKNEPDHERHNSSGGADCTHGFHLLDHDVASRVGERQPSISCLEGR